MNHLLPNPRAVASPPPLWLWLLLEVLRRLPRRH